MHYQARAHGPENPWPGAGRGGCPLPRPLVPLPPVMGHVFFCVFMQPRPPQGTPPLSCSCPMVSNLPWAHCQQTRAASKWGRRPAGYSAGGGRRAPTRAARPQPATPNAKSLRGWKSTLSSRTQHKEWSVPDKWCGRGGAGGAWGPACRAAPRGCGLGRRRRIVKSGCCLGKRGGQTGPKAMQATKQKRHARTHAARNAPAPAPRS